MNNKLFATLCIQDAVKTNKGKFQEIRTSKTVNIFNEANNEEHNIENFNYGELFERHLESLGKSAIYGKGKKGAYTMSGVIKRIEEKPLAIIPDKWTVRTLYGWYFKYHTLFEPTLVAKQDNGIGGIGEFSLTSLVRLANKG